MKKKLSAKINEGVQEAIANALEKHHKLGEAISIYQDGKVVTLKGDEITKLLQQK